MQRVCLIAFVLFSSVAFAQEKQAPEENRLAVSGSVRTLFEFDQDEIAGDDIDLSTYLRLDVVPFWDERASLHFYGRSRFDLNKDSVTDDALDDSDHRLFQAYMEVRKFPDPFRLRVGRQWIHEVEGVYLDGARWELPRWGDFDFVVFGGRPASAYSSTDGEAIFGGRIGYHPFKGTTVRISGVRSDESHPTVNDHIGIHVSQSFGNVARLSYDQKVLNRRNKDLRIGGNVHVQPLQLEMRGSYYNRIDRSPIPNRDDVEAKYFSDYFLLLDSVEELDRYSFTATKYFGDRLASSGGFSVTEIRGRENPTNRDTKRFFLSVQFFDLFLEKLHFSLDANWVTADLSSTTKTLFADIDGSTREITTEINQDDDAFFLTGQLEYTLFKGFKAAVGSSYGDFDFERALETTQPVLDTVPPSLLFSGAGERFITRTYFTEIDWKITKKWSARVLTEYNHSKINTGEDTGDYMRVLSSLRYRF